jgi:hypothetical protein
VDSGSAPSVSLVRDASWSAGITAGRIGGSTGRGAGGGVNVRLGGGVTVASSLVAAERDGARSLSRVTLGATFGNAGFGGGGAGVAMVSDVVATGTSTAGSAMSLACCALTVTGADSSGSCRCERSRGGAMLKSATNTTTAMVDEPESAGRARRVTGVRGAAFSSAND